MSQATLKGQREDLSHDDYDELQVQCSAVIQAVPDTQRTDYEPLYRYRRRSSKGSWRLSRLHWIAEKIPSPCFKIRCHIVQCRWWCRILWFTIACIYSIKFLIPKNPKVLCLFFLIFYLFSTDEQV